MSPLQKTEQIKSRLAEGGAVAVLLRGEKRVGVVEKINPQRAKVLFAADASGEANAYYVPYSRLELVDAQVDFAAAENQAIARATELLQKHNLPAWRAQLDDASARAGCCNFRNKIITISRLYARKVAAAELDDVILHEIAHALAGPRNHHNQVWKDIAMRIGCSGEVFHNETFSRPAWLAVCPNNCFAPIPRRRRGKRVCKKCRAPIAYQRALNG